MAIAFDIPNTEIIVTAGQTTVLCQDLLNAIRLFEDDFQMMANPKIADAEGKVSIGAIFSEIILKVLTPWTLRFEDEATQHTSVRGGTIVALDAIGAERPLTTNPSLTINQSISGTLIETGVSGLTAPESAAVLNTNTTVNANTTTLAGIETNIDTINTNIGLIQTDIGTINSNIVSINTSIGVINSSISSIGNDITAINVNLGLIQTQLDSMNRPKKNAAMNNFHFLMIDSVDKSSPKPGLTVTGMRCIDAGAWEPIENAVTEIAAGLYRVNLHANDTNGNNITYKFDAIGAVTRYITILTSP